MTAAEEGDRHDRSRNSGHLVLYVRDLERSAAFYGDVLGWGPVAPTIPGIPAAAFSSGRTHHELLLIEVGDGRRPAARAAVSSASTTSGSRWVTRDDELREALAG